MKKLLAYLLALVMVFGLVGCSSGSDTSADAPVEEETSDTVYTVGMVCIGNEEMAYDRNFYHAADAAKEILAGKGINIEWKYTYDHPEGDPVAEDCIEFAEDGAIAVFLNSYGMENAMLSVAADYPDTVFAALTNEGSKSDDLDNTVNAFPSIYEGRYLAGVAAGMKLNEMIDNGEITEDEAVLGYVGAYTYAEVVSGYTAFYLGAKSVCDSATMLVEFIGSWGDPAMEATTAQDLIDRGAVVVSQHSDSTTPATTCQQNGVYHIGYNIAMDDVAPEASIVSSKIDWTNYFVYVIETLVNGGTVDQDYMGHGLKDGDVVLTAVNENIAADGTDEAIETAANAIKDGSLQVFDTSKFTVDGQTVTEAMIDMDADFTPDNTNAISDGYYHESFYKSAPAFDLRIDGITLVNEAY
ncbi:MAG: BMP family ABC transporter substrate-binding protein [Firmicutes bacterium]|nr:BMP family ABC transporter substrate-binding protein [Bacillota bacterium]MDY4972126.1 BMP family ABC transporter substrate-binding protein [Erysipelotrichaceae bacterium]MDY5998408.1 BMP family ABC transporter substrate-binding protein [Erysipelotrichaceae bacterium]